MDVMFIGTMTSAEPSASW